MFIKSAKQQFSYFPLIVAPFSRAARRRAVPRVPPLIGMPPAPPLTGYRLPGPPVPAAALPGGERHREPAGCPPASHGSGDTAAPSSASAARARRLRPRLANDTRQIGHFTRLVTKVPFPKSSRSEAVPPDWFLRACFF